MSGLIASDSGGVEFKRVPAGVFTARCWSIIDLGTQNVEYLGDLKLQRKVQLSWELFGEDEEGAELLAEDGMPLTISKRYTLSLSTKSRLRPDLEAWRGKAFDDAELKGFDLSALLGKWCMINVAQSDRGGKTYSNVASITPIPRSMREALPEGKHKPRIFLISQPDMTLFNEFYDKLKETISSSVEWKDKGKVQARAPVAAGHDDDDIPF